VTGDDGLSSCAFKALMLLVWHLVCKKILPQQFNYSTDVVGHDWKTSALYHVLRGSVSTVLTATG